MVLVPISRDKVASKIPLSLRGICAQLRKYGEKFQRMIRDIYKVKLFSEFCNEIDLIMSNETILFETGYLLQ